MIFPPFSVLYCFFHLVRMFEVLFFSGRFLWSPHLIITYKGITPCGSVLCSCANSLVWTIHRLIFSQEFGLMTSFRLPQFARLEDARAAQSLNGQLDIAGRIIKVSFSLFCSIILYINWLILFMQKFHFFFLPSGFTLIWSSGDARCWSKCWWFWWWWWRRLG